MLFDDNSPVLSPSTISKISAHDKIVVFDLDETLGCFVELGMFCDALEKAINKPIEQVHFFEIMTLFPEFMRPNIINILSYLLDKKRRKNCKKIMIYTNNQGPRSWTENIAAFFSHILGEKVFDDIILAFKVHGKTVELCRTSHDKSVKDLVNCTKIPKDTKVCFLDDQFHPEMEHDNVFYINVKPYTANLPFKEMSERYYAKYTHPDIEPVVFHKKIVEHMKRYNFTVVTKSDDAKKVDRVISKQIVIYLEEFFRKHQKKGTRKRRGRHKSLLTRRKRESRGFKSSMM